MIYFIHQDWNQPTFAWVICRAVASLTFPGGQEFQFPHFFLKFWSILLIFPQTFLIFFLIMALRVGKSPTQEGPGYATGYLGLTHGLKFWSTWPEGPSRPHSNPPTNGLGALEISLLFCNSFTCNGLGALSCSFNMVLKMDALQNPYFKVWVLLILARGSSYFYMLRSMICFIQDSKVSEIGCTHLPKE